MSRLVTRPIQVASLVYDRQTSGVVSPPRLGGLLRAGYRRGKFGPGTTSLWLLPLCASRTLSQGETSSLGLHGELPRLVAPPVSEPSDAVLNATGVPIPRRRGLQGSVDVIAKIRRGLFVCRSPICRPLRPNSRGARRIPRSGMRTPALTQASTLRDLRCLPLRQEPSVRTGHGCLHERFLPRRRCPSSVL